MGVFVLIGAVALIIVLTVILLVLMHEGWKISADIDRTAREIDRLQAEARRR